MTQHPSERHYKVKCTARDQYKHPVTFTTYVIAQSEVSARLRAMAKGYKQFPHLNYIWGESAEAVVSIGKVSQ